MPTYERSVLIEAPFADVWDFHASIDGLEALTPGWLGLEVESVRGPDGDPDPDVLDAGSTATVSLRPFGVGPRQRATTTILDRERRGDWGYFRDEMRGGPFASWVHTHTFEGEGTATRVRDRVEYDLAGGSLGRGLGPLAVVGLAPLFRYRHHRTKALLE